MARRGRMVSLEGGEGVGKSTQAKALAAALRRRGIDVCETREPGGSPGAEAIRKLLLEGTAERWTARSEALLFAAARADHAARTIAPALEEGRWVLSDRFVDSSLAYQGAAGGLGLEAVRVLHQFGSEGLWPDRTLVLLLSEGEAAARIAARDGDRSDRIASRGSDYHRAVEQAFRSLAADDPQRVRLVDASGHGEQITERLLAELSDLLQ